jgi:hypothetical protein
LALFFLFFLFTAAARLRQSKKATQLLGGARQGKGDRKLVVRWGSCRWWRCPSAALLLEEDTAGLVVVVELGIFSPAVLNEPALSCSAPLVSVYFRQCAVSEQDAAANSVILLPPSVGGLEQREPCPSHRRFGGANTSMWQQARYCVINVRHASGSSLLVI